MAVLSYKTEVDGFKNKTIILENDIILNQESRYGVDGIVNTSDDWSETVSPDYEWIGIGVSEPKFQGSFDGNQKTISGVYVNATQDCVGLFNYSNSLADIKNFTLLNSYFHTTGGGIGSIAGRGDGDFDTIYSDAIVDGTTTWIGGFVGRTNGSYGAQMNNCWFDGSVSQDGRDNSTQKAATGGLVGLSVKSSSLINCLNSGSVSSTYVADATPCVGGLVGKIEVDFTLSMENCLNTGSVTVAEDAESCYGSIFGGYIDDEKDALINISDTYALMGCCEGEQEQWSGVNYVDENSCNGTDALKNMTNLFTNKVSSTEYDSCWAVVLGDVPVLESFVEVTDKEFLIIDTSWYNGNASYMVNDVSDFYGFALLSYKTNFANKTVTLGADIAIPNEGKAKDWVIAVPDYEWVSIGGSSSYKFAGTFDGNNKTISGIYLSVTESGQDRKGLFSYTTSASKIRNFRLINSYFSMYNSMTMGSIAGEADGLFENIYSNAIIIGAQYNIGGLVGRAPANSNLRMTNCWFDGSVVNNAGSCGRTGGLIGTVLSNASIANCLNTAKISAPNYKSGSDDVVVDDTTTLVNPSVGGLVGFVRGGTLSISCSLNVGEVTCRSEADCGYGSIAGYVYTTYTTPGQLSLSNTYATAESCTSLGTNVAAPDCEVSEADIAGTNAIAKLQGFDFNDNWLTVMDGTPVLKSFESMIAPSVEADGKLQTMLSLYDELTAVKGSTITLPSQPPEDKGFTIEGTVTRQGGYMDKEGKYFYQAYIIKVDETEVEGLVGTGANNEVVIAKYDLETGETTWSDSVMYMNHANDIAFNSKEEYLVVCHGVPYRSKVSYISLDTLQQVGEPVDIGRNIYSIDYNETYDCYVVGNSGGQSFSVLDTEFNLILGAYQPTEKTKSYTTQGVTCDDDYIYFALHNENVITVYDWSGTFVSLINLDVGNEEPENISIIGDKLYVMTTGSEGAIVHVYDTFTTQ